MLAYAIYRIQTPQLRLSYAFWWTIFLIVILTQSSSQPTVGPPMPPGEPSIEREFLLTIGHLVSFGSLTLLWHWALVEIPNHVRRVLIVLAIAVPLGILTELFQFTVVDREPSFYDIAMNLLAIIGAILYCHLRNSSQTKQFMTIISR